MCTCFIICIIICRLFMRLQIYVAFKQYEYDMNYLVIV